MARSSVSFGMLAAKARSMASRSRGLLAGSGPPMRAATVASRISLVKILPRFASWAFLRCWMLAHLLCPAIYCLVSPVSMAPSLAWGRGPVGADGVVTRGWERPVKRLFVIVLAAVLSVPGAAA